MYFNQDAAMSALNDKLQKLVDQIVYYGRNISSTESDINVAKGCQKNVVWKVHISSTWFMGMSWLRRSSLREIKIARDEVRY